MTRDITQGHGFEVPQNDGNAPVGMTPINPPRVPAIHGRRRSMPFECRLHVVSHPPNRLHVVTWLRGWVRQLVTAPARQIRIGSILDLVTSGALDAESDLRKVYELRAQVELSAARGFFGLATGLLLSVVATSFQKDFAPRWWAVVAVFTGALILVLAGATYYRRYRNVEGEYLDAMALLARLKQISPVLSALRRWVQ